MQQYHEAMMRVRKLQQEIDDLKNQSRPKELAALRILLEEKQRLLHLLEQQVYFKESSMHTLQHENSALHRECEELRRKTKEEVDAELQHELEKFRQEVEDLKQNLEQACRRNAELQEENDELRQKYEEACEGNEKSKCEVKELQDENGHLRWLVKDERCEGEKELKELRRETMQLQQEDEKLRQEVEEVQQENEKLRHEVEELRQMNMALRQPNTGSQERVASFEQTLQPLVPSGASTHGREDTSAEAQKEVSSALARPQEVSHHSVLDGLVQLLPNFLPSADDGDESGDESGDDSGSEKDN